MTHTTLVLAVAKIVRQHTVRWLEQFLLIVEFDAVDLQVFDQLLQRIGPDAAAPARHVAYIRLDPVVRPQDALQYSPEGDGLVQVEYVRSELFEHYVLLVAVQAVEVALVGLERHDCGVFQE